MIDIQLKSEIDRLIYSGRFTVDRRESPRWPRYSGWIFGKMATCCHERLLRKIVVHSGEVSSTVVHVQVNLLAIELINL